MPRNLSSGFKAALGQKYLYPAFFVEINLKSGPVRVSTCYQPQILASVLYTGVGSVLEFSTIEDGSTVLARGVTVTLSAIDVKLLPAILNDFQVGLDATIYFGLFAGQGELLINQPIVAWAGRTDQPTISFPTPDQATISLALESLLLDMNTPVPYRWTNVDQQLFHPGDLGLGFVNSIQDKPLYWGQNSTNNDGNP